MCALLGGRLDVKVGGASGFGHAGVVGDESFEFGAESECAGDVDRVERAELGRGKPAGDFEDVRIQIHERESREDGLCLSLTTRIRTSNSAHQLRDNQF